MLKQVLLDPLDAQAASLFSASERVRKYKNGAAELKDLIRLYEHNT